MKRDRQFSDLMPRIVSAVVLLVIAFVNLWVGGVFFEILLIFIAALMAWEISAMHDPRKMLALLAGLGGGLGAFVMFAFSETHAMYVFPCVVIFAGVIAAVHWKAKLTVCVSLIVFIYATYVLEEFREVHGFSLTLWLILCVVASDTGGYFAGKIVGGPKLWARISPKKTWSGTIGGWIAAVGVSFVFVYGVGFPFWLVSASILIAVAGQIGDLTESAVKRRAEVKDSSALIPGHGGFLDRFDGILGASVFVGIAQLAGAA